MIGWVQKISSGWINSNDDDDEIDHWYNYEKSVCLENELLSPPAAKYDDSRLHLHCEECVDFLNSDVGKKLIDGMRKYDGMRSEFIEKYDMEPERVVLNYVEYHGGKSLNLDDVVTAVSRWGGNMDWRACILRCVVSGSIRPEIIRSVEKINA